MLWLPNSLGLTSISMFLALVWLRLWLSIACIWYWWLIRVDQGCMVAGVVNTLAVHYERYQNTIFRSAAKIRSRQFHFISVVFIDCPYPGTKNSNVNWCFRGILTNPHILGYSITSNYIYSWLNIAECVCSCRDPIYYNIYVKSFFCDHLQIVVTLWETLC